MNLDAGRWGLLEKARDYRFVLHLLAFSLLADLVLLLVTGVSLVHVSLSELGARPGLLLLMVLAYGLATTLGAGLLELLPMTFLAWLVQMASHRLEGSAGPRVARVASRNAPETPSGEPLASTQMPGQACKAERRAERQRWHSMVGAGSVCIALIGWSMLVPGTAVSLLRDWAWWAPWLLLSVPGLPCCYHLFVVAPSSDSFDGSWNAE